MAKLIIHFFIFLITSTCGNKFQDAYICNKEPCGQFLVALKYKFPHQNKISTSSNLYWQNGSGYVYQLTNNNYKTPIRNRRTEALWQFDSILQKRNEKIGMKIIKTNQDINDKNGDKTTKPDEIKQFRMTSSHYIGMPFTRASQRTLHSFKQSPSPSFIEFSYIDLDVNDERFKRRDSSMKNQIKLSPPMGFQTNNHIHKIREVLSSRPITSQTKTHIRKVRTSKVPLKSQLKFSTTQQRLKLSQTRLNQARTNRTPQSKENKWLDLFIHEFKNNPTTSNPTKMHRRYPLKNKRKNTDNTTMRSTSSSAETKTIATSFNFNTNKELTTVYDRIKFFEMYDRKTVGENNGSTKKSRFDDFSKEFEDCFGKRKNRSKYYETTEPLHSLNSVSRLESVDILSTTTLNDQEEYNAYTDKINAEPKVIAVNYSNSPDFNQSRASWYQYPFVAVYIYEPYQVRCDAAGISSHWLIVSGSCLARHHKHHSSLSVKRSAYVAYCGYSWRIPEHIAYVKYSVVHPNFHRRDRIRRQLYNIGLVQVSNSMSSACNIWTPVTLMTHPFASNRQGTVVTALGWGLDRFDTRFSYSELPDTMLMTYQATVFSDSCPGHIGYREAREEDPLHGVTNIYCLLLPPYNGEQNDLVHGGLLMHGGKLIALYLQEERRAWGEQSAQYTGISSLIPWVLSVAREFEDAPIEM